MSSVFISLEERKKESQRTMGKTRGAGSYVRTARIWLMKQPMKIKSCLAVVLFVCSLVALKFLLRSRYFFIASESIHAAGIMALIYKLNTKKTCSGLSLKSQELTAIFLAARLVCSIIMEADIHTVLDFATFASTAWVIYMIRFKLKSSYIKELDNFPIIYIVLPSVILALLIHPSHNVLLKFSSVLWAFCVYVESVSVLPQLRMMQNTKMIEPFTSHYVFALGVARFLSFAHWILQLIETRGRYLFLIGYGYFWFPLAFLAEMIQTFILADFCYYYIKSLKEGQLLMRMPV